MLQLHAVSRSDAAKGNKREEKMARQMGYKTNNIHNKYAITLSFSNVSVGEGGERGRIKVEECASI
jgi:hypothetical protein